MKNLFFAAMAIASVSLLATGCTDMNTAGHDSLDTPAETNGHDHGHNGHDHAHNLPAPHGGQLIELGRNHEYHAELLDDDQNESVTIYMLDGHLQPVSIDASSIQLVMITGDQTRTFELLASQPAGSSEFRSSDPDLTELLETDGVQGKLRVTINDTPFSGVFDHHDHDPNHDHDDDGHDHE